MAGASDKARFYLEQSVPGILIHPDVQYAFHLLNRYISELQEFSRKKIFSKDEITSIAKRRSDFEHKLNARGSAPIDYARYAEYEMNLESLRRKRVQRLGVKTTNHSGQRRIFFVLDRATKKFPGDLGLWMQYVGFARKQKSNKKVSQILTSLVRLHPTKADVWIYAANYAMDELGDMTESRGYMQRGLRFCKGDERLWLEYARLEMFWVAKVWKRRRILGVDVEPREARINSDEGIDGDIVTLLKLTEEDINPGNGNAEGTDQEALENLTKSPALSGAIPMAILDSAMKQFNYDETLCLQFFDMVCEFDDLPCLTQILNHIMDVLERYSSPAALIRYVQQPVKGFDAASPGFPTAFGLCLDRMKMAFTRSKPLPTLSSVEGPRHVLDEQIIDWLLEYLDEKDLDLDVRRVISMTVRRVWNQYQSDIEADPRGKAAKVATMISKLHAHGMLKVSEPAMTWAMGLWPDDSELFPQVVNHSNQ